MLILFFKSVQCSIISQAIKTFLSGKIHGFETDYEKQLAGKVNLLLKVYNMLQTGKSVIIKIIEFRIHL